MRDFEQILYLILFLIVFIGGIAVIVTGKGVETAFFTLWVMLLEEYAYEFKRRFEKKKIRKVANFNG